MFSNGDLSGVQGLDDDDMSGGTVTLVCGDRREELDRSCLMACTLFKTALENDEECKEIPISDTYRVGFPHFARLLRLEGEIGSLSDPPFPIRSDQLIGLYPNHRPLVDVVNHLWNKESREEYGSLVQLVLFADHDRMLTLLVGVMGAACQGKPTSELPRILSMNPNR